MPWHVEKRDDEWCVIKDDDGSSEGCHGTEDAARRQLRALYANEPSAAKAAASQRVMASVPMQVAQLAKGDGRTMVGYATTWDQPITDAGGWFPADRMYLRRGTLKKTLAEQADRIKVLFNHGHDPTVGEKPLGKPSVMREDDYGFWTETPLLDTSWNRDLIELLRAGAIDGMSMTFEAVDYGWIEDGEALEVTQARLYEFGPVTFPAGQGTSATLMSASRVDAAYHDHANARAEGTEAGGRLAPPPTLEALTWRRTALPVIRAEREFLEDQRKRTEALARG